MDDSVPLVQVREWMLATDPRIGMDGLWPSVVIFNLIHVLSTGAQVILGASITGRKLMIQEGELGSVA